MEEGDRPQHIANLFEQGLGGLKANACNIARTQEIRGGHRATTGFYAKLGKTVEHDPGQERKIANDERKEADIEDFL